MTAFKTCACCGLNWTLHQFLRLASPAGGRKDMLFEEAGVRFRVVMRQCRCDSTMAIELRLQCKGPECTKDMRAGGGYCTGHAAQLARGTPLRPLKPKALDGRDRRSAANRFADLVSPEPNTGCFLWLGSVAEQGYGLFPMPGSGGYAHRAALLLSIGPSTSPRRTYALHSCDNRLCVNERHLRWGTQKENIAEARDRGRIRLPGLRGEDHSRARCTEAQISQALEMVAGGLTRVAAARAVGITAGTLYQAASGRSWKHLGITTPQEAP